MQCFGPGFSGISPALARRVLLSLTLSALAVQREETQRLQERFAASGYQLRALMREVALGDNFRRAAPPAAATPDGGTP